MSKSLYAKMSDDSIEKLDVEKVTSAAIARFKEEDGGEIPPHVSGEGEDAQTTPGEEIVKYLVEGIATNASEDNTVDWDQFAENTRKPFQKILAIIVEMIGTAEENAAEYKKGEADAKEKAKQSKAQDAEKVELRKSLFVKAAKTGIDKAKEAFVKELESLKDNLPKGVSIETNDVGGAGLVFAEGATEESISEAMAYFTASCQNNQHLIGQLQFFAGAAVNQSVKLGIYRSNAEASKYIAKQMEETMNYKIGPRTLENYARMDERVPVNLRNISVDPSAYFAVASAGSPKQLKGESKENLKVRVAAHEADRLKILEKMKSGKATVKNDAGEEIEVELSSRADILPLVTNMQIQHKILTPKDPDEMSVADYLKQFFFSFMAKEYLEGVFEEGTVIFKASAKIDNPDAEDIEIPNGETIKIVKVASSDLTDWMEEAKNNLQNVLFAQQGLTMNDFMEGVTTVKVPRTTEVEGKTIPVKDSITKQQLYDSVEIPAYPNWPFTKSAPCVTETVEEEAAA